MTAFSESEQEYATLPTLLQGLGYTAENDASVGAQLEAYAESHLFHDAYLNLTDWGEDGAREFVVLGCEGVVMWVLEFPVTRQQLDEYLDELDVRIGRMRTIHELSDSQDDQPSSDVIESVIGSAFNVDVEKVRGDLGTSWRRIASDAVGTSSSPVAYVGYNTCAVVGLDDQYIYVFRVDGEGEVRDAYDGGVAWEAEWPEDGDSSLYESFVASLREVATSGSHPAAG